MSRISEAEIEAIALGVARALQQARSVSDSEHYDHHKWITGKMKAEARRAEFWEKMAEHVAKWGAVSVISAIFYAAYLGFKDQFLNK